MHISELAQHHVENPREVVSQGDLVQAKIIEVDAERRRLSLSLKRVEGGGVTQRADDSEAIEGTPNLDLSEEVFPEGAPEASAVEDEPAPDETETEAEIEADQVAPDEPGPGDSEGEAPSAPE